MREREREEKERERNRRKRNHIDHISHAEIKTISRYYYMEFVLYVDFSNYSSNDREVFEMSSSLHLVIAKTNRIREDT